jgi:hypothetical protein
MILLTTPEIKRLRVGRRRTGSSGSRSKTGAQRWTWRSAERAAGRRRDAHGSSVVLSGLCHLQAFWRTGQTLPPLTCFLRQHIGSSKQTAL